MNGQLRTAALGLVVVAALVTGADDRDLYERLGATLIYSPDFSNEEVHRLVATGITSDDPEIVELTLDAIGVMAQMTVLGIWMENLDMLYGPSTVHTWPKRALAEVPGLKALLLQRFELEYEVWDPEEVRTDLPAQGLTIEEMFAAMPGWSFIPAVLALHWPGDADVERILLDKDWPIAKPGKLVLLNVGGFTSAEANAVRIGALTDDSIGRNVRIELPHDPDASPEKLAELAERSALEEQRQARFHAVQGLALSRLPEAIPQLIASGIEWPRPAILESLERYDDAELMPHRKDLKKMLSRMHERFFTRDDIPETHDLLEDFRSRFADAPSGALP
ncbi:MAG: hypothetical protein OXT64_08860 [Gammaproteobacteria bacterium]|nr:hypothetical protein [Gammaproteobacteria bacterium]